MENRYRVIKGIPKGWETSAKVGEILTVAPWNGELTLMKDSKAVCNIDSKYANEYCEKIQ